MIETFKKIWQFAGDEKKNINQSVWISFLSAILQMFQVGAIYLVIRALTEGAQGGRTAWLALLFELISIFGGAVTASFSKLHQTHAGYFMAADRRIAIADRMKSVPMGFFSANSLGQVSGVCTTVVGSIESMVPMVLVNILSGLITTAVFTLLLLLWNWRIGLIALAGIAVYLLVVSAMEKKSAAIAQDSQKSQTALTEAVLETVQGMSVVKSFNLTGKGDKKLQDALENHPRSNLQVEHVMTPYTAVQEAVLQIAAWQLGVLESPAGSNTVKYNEAFYGRRVAGSAYPWCLTFVWWVFREAGFSLARTASCSELRRRYQAAGQWVTEGYRPGDILLFDFSGRRAKTEHAGILERLEPDGTLVTLEGNTGAGSDANGGAVQRRRRRPGFFTGACGPRYYLS